MATFFVVAIIDLRQSSLFTDEQKLEHPRILFPVYYGFEFSLIGAALAGQLAARRARVALPDAAARVGRVAAAIEVLLVAGALIVGLVDYFAVYRPLASMIEQPVLPATFFDYHRASRWMNGSLLGLCAAALAVGVYRSGGRRGER